MTKTDYSLKRSFLLKFSSKKMVSLFWTRLNIWCTNLKPQWKKVSLYCTTLNDIFWTGCASAKKLISHLLTQHLMQKPENHFWKEFSVRFTLLKRMKCFEKDVFSRIRTKKANWYIKNQLNNWFNCLGERKNQISDEIFLCRIKLKKQFSQKFLFFQLLSEKIVVWEAALSKVHYRNCGL